RLEAASMMLVVVGRRLLGPAFLAAVVRRAMRHARHHEPGVVLLAHTRQLLDKRDGRPQLLVAVIAPGRHPSHLDAVFEDPEQLGGTIKLCGFGEIWRLRIKTASDVALGHTGCATANGAMCREMLEAHGDVRRVVKVPRDMDTGRMRLD